MVAPVLSLKWRSTLHSMRRDWWRVLVLVSGVIWSITLVPSVWFAQRVLSYQHPDLKTDALVATASVLVLGWCVVPLLITGLDDTLEPTRFASLGVSARRLMPGMTVAAFLTVPALFFLAAMLVLALAWEPEPWPALPVALAGAGLTVAVMVMSARVAVGWGTRVLGSRRARLVALAAGAVIIAALAPAAVLLFRDGLELVLDYDVPVLISSLGATPIASGMAAPHAAADGDLLGVAWRLALPAAWVVLLHGAWRASVAHALVHPRQRGGGERRRDDRILVTQARSERWDATLARVPGPLGVAARRVRARAAAPPAARAVRSRALRAWASDPRYLSAGVGAMVFPLLFFAVVMPSLGLATWWAYAVPLLLAASIGWGRHNDVAYDSTAMWLDLVSGRRGHAVMRGRVEATLAWAVPAVLAACVLAVLATGEWALAPGLVGAAIGALGATVGVSAVMAVAMPYRAPQPGSNPFTAEVGSLGAGLAAQVVSSFASAAIAPLVTVPFVLGVIVHPAWAGVSAVTGPVLGVAAVVLAVRVSGTLYDSRSGRLLGAVA